MTDPYIGSKPVKPKPLYSFLQRPDVYIILLITLIGIAVRFHQLDQPTEVVFDEVHFGGFAGQYINGTYYFDVHPPLAKMMIAWSGQVFGYQGDFDFGTIGNSYLDSGVPFVAMRAACALLGSLLVPMAYITLRDGGHSIPASLVAAAAVCFENSLVANSRLILLDAYLLFFTAWTLMSWNKFFLRNNRPFTFSWWIWLAMTGVGLGCTVSCKWVGLFMIATIGCSTLYQLWKLWGDLQTTMTRFMQHFLARGLCLIVLPIVIYIGTFYLHFYFLTHSGSGDSMMSSYFQHSLIGNEIQDSPLDIAYGSAVTFRHMGTNGGYLHSHKSVYPEGSQQQQITLYPYQDDNNWWMIRKINSTMDLDDKETSDVLGSDEKTWLEYVRHGDLIRLEHIMTSPKRLHSHDHPAPVSGQEAYKEVSGYGFPDYEGDSNDYWRVMIPDNSNSKDNDNRLLTLRTTFQLIHPLQSCALYSGNKKLPDWGFGQQEVACIQNGKLPKTLWMVEETRHDLLPEDKTTLVNYPRPGFWFKFKELHQKMWTANNELTESHPYQSRPSDWPMLRRGVSFWARDHRHVYFFGNPVLYWASTVSIFTFLILSFFFKVRAHRQIQERFDPQRQAYYQQAAGFYTMAWAFHYLPFWIMGRQLFLHHYLPALYFALLVFGVAMDCVLQKWATAAAAAAAAMTGEVTLTRDGKSTSTIDSQSSSHTESKTTTMTTTTTTTIRTKTATTTTGTLTRHFLLRWTFTGLCVLIIVTLFYQYAPLTYGSEWDQQSCQDAQWLPLWEFDCGRYTQGQVPVFSPIHNAPTSFSLNAKDREAILQYPHHSEL